MEQTPIALESFVDKIKKLYPELRIEIDYDNLNNHYEIWHDNPSLQFEDENFIVNVGTLISDVFKQRVYNFSFGYDHFKAIAAKSYSYVSNRETTIDIPDGILKAINVILEYFENNSALFEKEVQMSYKRYDVLSSKPDIVMFSINDEEMAA